MLVWRLRWRLRGVSLQNRNDDVSQILSSTTAQRQLHTASKTHSVRQRQRTLAEPRQEGGYRKDQDEENT